eukprot:UC4_evm1s443
MSIYPARITVVPDPVLHFVYFLEETVYSDDPFTEQIEPPVPFELAVAIHNAGYGIANDLAITSPDVSIVENKKGLLLEFELLSLEVNGTAFPAALESRLGSLKPQTSINAAWKFRTNIMGSFKNFSANWDWTNPLGDDRLSVVESLSMYGLVHRVPGEYGLSYYL